MAVSGPPRRPDSRDPTIAVEPDRGGVAIETSGRRAPRTRRSPLVVGTLAAIAVVAAVTVAVVSDGAGRSSHAEPAVHLPAAAPAPARHGEAADLVDAWGRIREGWVLIYGDGRVIWYPESGSTLYADQTRDLVVERRLSPAGIAKLRSGELSASDIDGAGRDPLPADLWADPEFRPYVPSEYALCLWEYVDRRGRWVNVAKVLDDLPTAQHSLLRGTQRPYSAFSFLPSTIPPELLQPTTCFGLNPEAAAAVVAMGGRSNGRYRVDGELVSLPSRHGGELTFAILPVMPHGQFVLWDG